MASFFSLLEFALFCGEWKHEAILSQTLKTPLAFDESGKSNLLIKGELSLYTGNPVAAEKIFLHSIEQLEEAKDRDSTNNATKYWMNIAACKSGLAQIKLDEKNKLDAEVLAAEAVDICKLNMNADLGSKLDTSSIYGGVLTTFAESELAQGKREEADKAFRQAEDLFKHVGNTTELNECSRRYALSKRLASKYAR